MAYNKARAEKQWLKWKEAEEKKLRSWAWIRKPSSACIHTTGQSLTRNASICSDR